ncbi:MAG: hypothetical protein K6U88_05045, partial [Dehalococcoidia bacterium]|nr:hypothetical protein [Dehalococcoidia bacterium]
MMLSPPQCGAPAASAEGGARQAIFALQGQPNPADAPARTGGTAPLDSPAGPAAESVPKPVRALEVP